MKKILTASILLSAFFITAFCVTSFSHKAFAAKYKVNTGGKVKDNRGKTQNSSLLNTQNNFYTNYSSQNYVNSKQVQKNGVSTIDIVMDYSGSMYYWINEAKKSMTAIVSQLPAGTSVGFRVFGHDGGNNPYSPIVAKVKSITKKSNGGYKVSAATPDYLGNTGGSCSATEQIVKVAQNDSATLLNGMNSVDMGGSTPLTLALKQSVDVDFANMPQTFRKKIILITDGGENCGGDPCAYAKLLVKQRKDITVDVVLVSSSSKSLKCLADTTGGRFYTTDDLSSFASSLYSSMTDQGNVTNNIPQQPQPQQHYEYVDE